MQLVPINERVEKIKSDIDEINRFVEEFKPFIASCTEKAVGRYVRYGEDDELSVALMAFVESIYSYDIVKGSFLSFSQNVIKRRLIDYYRKEKKRHAGVISLNEYYSNDNEELDMSMSQAIDKYSDEEINEYRRLEIEELKDELSKWGISFIDLVEACPKHVRTRKMCADIIRYIQSHQHLMYTLMNKKYLPVAEIENALKIPRKKIERLRKYIIASVIINTGDYQYIKEYIK